MLAALRWQDTRLRVQQRAIPKMVEHSHFRLIDFEKGPIYETPPHTYQRQINKQ